MNKCFQVRHRRRRCVRKLLKAQPEDGSKETSRNM